MNERPYNIDRGLVESKLIDAVLRLQRHLDGLAKLRAECEACERELAGSEWDDLLPENRRPTNYEGDQLDPCWKLHRDGSGSDVRKALLGFEDVDGHIMPLGGPLTAEARARLVAEHYCPACQRGEVKIRDWYDGRRQTGGKRAAVTRLARRLLTEAP